MTSFDTNRRSVLKLAGAVAATTALAGCSDDDNGNGNGDGTDDDDEFQIDPGTEVVLDGYQSHWEGVEPSDIDGVENPTLVLEAGEEYTFEWINADGIQHDLQIRDDGGDVLHETDTIGDEGEGDSVTFTAEPEMVTYICSLHEASQVGDLVVE